MVNKRKYVNKRVKNSTKVPNAVNSDGIMTYSSLYETEGNEDLYLTVGLKLNLNNVNIEKIDSESGLITLSAIEISANSTIEERTQIAYNLIKEMQDEILSVVISKIDKPRFEILVGMYDTNDSNSNGDNN